MPVLLGSFSQRPDGMDLYAWPTASKPHAGVFAGAKVQRQRSMQQAATPAAPVVVAMRETSSQE